MKSERKNCRLREYLVINPKIKVKHAMHAENYKSLQVCG